MVEAKLALTEPVACTLPAASERASTAGTRQRAALALRLPLAVNLAPTSMTTAALSASSLALASSSTRILGRLASREATARAERVPAAVIFREPGLHSALAWTLALHEPEHSADAEHLALGSLPPEHLGALTVPSHEPEHSPSHWSLTSAAALHEPRHLPAHEPLHEPLQTGFVNWTEHEPSQVPSHLPENLPPAPSPLPLQVPLQSPEQVPDRPPSQVPSHEPSQVPEHSPSQVTARSAEPWHEPEHEPSHENETSPPSHWGSSPGCSSHEALPEHLAWQLAEALALSEHEGGWASMLIEPAALSCATTSPHQAAARAPGSVSCTFFSSMPMSTATFWQSVESSSTRPLADAEKSPEACMKAANSALPSPSISQSTALRSAPTLKSLQQAASVIFFAASQPEPVTIGTASRVTRPSLRNMLCFISSSPQFHGPKRDLRRPVAVGRLMDRFIRCDDPGQAFQPGACDRPR